MYNDLGAPTEGDGNHKALSYEYTKNVASGEMTCPCNEWTTVGWHWYE